MSGEPVASGDGLKLTFGSLESSASLALFSSSEAREVVTALEDEFRRVDSRSGPHLLASADTGVTVGILAGLEPEARRSQLEREVLKQYELLYGPAQVPLSASLERASWFQALKLSPRYMGAGVREAAEELFSSPTVLLSVGISMMIYMVAWAAPEPLFSKAFAASVTLGLLLTYRALELYNVGMACLTPRFEDLFAQAGMELDDPSNIVYLRGHQGPHPEEYHRELFRRLDAALGTCRSVSECRARLVDELDRIAGEVCTPGSKLNKFATGQR